MSASALEFLKRVHDQSLISLGPVRFDKDLRRDGIVTALYTALIERAGTIILLMDNERSYGASSVFRSFLENYVEFENLNRDPKYWNFMCARFHKSWVDLLRDASTNPFLHLLSAAGHDKTTLQSHEKYLKELKEKGYHPLRVDKRFQMAGMGAEYRSVYALESSEIHSDLRNLFRANISNENGEIEVHLYREHALGEFEAILDSVASLLLKASIKLHERLASGNEAALSILVAEYNERCGNVET